jgi:isocitrate dehydrogenase (NAD+)
LWGVNQGEALVAYRVTLIPGDGIGPEVTKAMTTVLEATGVELEWIQVEAGVEVIEKYGTPLPPQVLESIRETKVAIKGPIGTPVGTGFRSVNVAIRKELDLYANLRPAKSIPGIKSPFQNIDLVVVREPSSPSQSLAAAASSSLLSNMPAKMAAKR